MSTAKDMDLLLNDFSLHHVPGCGCIVMKDGKVIYEGYTGLADIKNGRKVGSDTIFRPGMERHEGS